MSKLHVYILLDRSGSMGEGDKWAEALGSLNSYVAELGREGETADATVTLAAFDHHSGLDYRVLRRAVAAREWQPVTEVEASPRGGTPLHDAVVRAASEAEGLGAERLVVVIITDGHENMSREATREGARAALDRLRGRGHQVVHLGADFDAYTQAEGLGTARGQTVNTTRGNYESATVSLARETRSHLATGQSIRFTEEDRDAAEGKAKP